MAKIRELLPFATPVPSDMRFTIAAFGNPLYDRRDPKTGKLIYWRQDFGPGDGNWEIGGRRFVGRILPAVGIPLIAEGTPIREIRGWRSAPFNIGTPGQIRTSSKATAKIRPVPIIADVQGAVLYGNATDLYRYDTSGPPFTEAGQVAPQFQKGRLQKSLLPMASILDNAAIDAPKRFTIEEILSENGVERVYEEARKIAQIKIDRRILWWDAETQAWLQEIEELGVRRPWLGTRRALEAGIPPHQNHQRGLVVIDVFAEQGKFIPDPGYLEAQVRAAEIPQVAAFYRQLLELTERDPRALAALANAEASKQLVRTNPNLNMVVSLGGVGGEPLLGILGRNDGGGGALEGA